MMGVYQFIGSIGMMVFSKIGGYTHDVYGPEYPFMVVAVFDILLIILLLFFTLYGKFNH